MHFPPFSARGDKFNCTLRSVFFCHQRATRCNSFSPHAKSFSILPQRCSSFHDPELLRLTVCYVIVGATFTFGLRIRRLSHHENPNKNTHASPIFSDCTTRYAYRQHGDQNAGLHGGAPSLHESLALPFDFSAETSLSTRCSHTNSSDVFPRTNMHS